MANYHKEYRCIDCKKLMFKGFLIESEIEVKCKKCGKLNLFQGEDASQYICWKEGCPNRIATKKSE